MDNFVSVHCVCITFVVYNVECAPYVGIMCLQCTTLNVRTMCLQCTSLNVMSIMLVVYNVLCVLAVYCSE